MRQKLDWILKHVYLLILIGIIGYGIFGGFFNCSGPAPADRHTTDTILKEVHHYHTTEAPAVNNTPTIIYVSPKADPVYRKEAEKEPIITGVQVKPGEIDIQKVDTNGVVTQEVHKVDPESTVTIDNKGVNEKKKTKAGKFLKKAAKRIEQGFAIVGAGVLLILAGKHL